MGKVFKALSKAALSGEGQQTRKVENADALENAAIAHAEPDKPVTSSNEDENFLPEKNPASRNTPQPAEDEALGGNLGNWDERLVAINDADSLIAESFRRLRARILHPENGKPLRTILFTSAVPGEGKSFICANLGITLAQSVEKHALIVDCDLRRSSIAPLFGLNNDKGVVNHLREGTDLAELIQKTGLRKLSILSSGPSPINPAELLDSKKMSAMIQELTARYSDRFILLDTPPMQAASETTVLAKHVDGIVVVVKWGGAGRQQVKELVEAIGKEKIVGIVFNAYEQTLLEKSIGGYGYEAYYSTKK